MAVTSRLESKFGLTRGDVTIAMFLAATSLTGFIYTTFFDDRSGNGGHREMLQLVARHDSIVAAHREARLVEVRKALATADSVPEWKPLTATDEATEETAERVERTGNTSGGKDLPAGPVDLNHASKSELMKLPGVGEKTAVAIIDRRGHVPFRRVEDIMQVKGIGEKKFQKMKPYLTVR